jgi:hypothetical protein
VPAREKNSGSLEILGAGKAGDKSPQATMFGQTQVVGACIILLVVGGAANDYVSGLEADTFTLLEAPRWWLHGNTRSRRALESIDCAIGGNAHARVWDRCATSSRKRGNRMMTKQQPETVCNFVADQPGCYPHVEACNANDFVGAAFRAACPASCGYCKHQRTCNGKLDSDPCYENIVLNADACSNSFTRTKCPGACKVEGCPQF